MPPRSESSEWTEWFRSLDALTETADRGTRARRGREFERLLVQMLGAAQLKPRASFRPAGEEIDGSFVHRDRVMLLEAKWTTDAQPASALYAFRGKVEGKLTGTLGLFVSISGFSKDAINALVSGKALNLILMTGEDIRAIVNGGINIVDALDLKLRAAAEYGTPLAPIAGLAGVNGDAEVPINEPQADGEGPTTAVVSEGNFDQFVLTALSSLHRPGVEGTVFFSAGGRNNLGLVAQTIVANLPNAGQVVIVADGNGDPESARSTITQRSLPSVGRRIAQDVIILEPNLETVFGLVNPSTGRRLQSTGLDRHVILERLHSLDLPALARMDPDVRQLLDALRIPFAG